MHDIPHLALPADTVASFHSVHGDTPNVNLTHKCLILKCEKQVHCVLMKKTNIFTFYEFLNTDDILDALLPLSDCSEDLDDVDADPDFEVSSDEDDRRTPRKIQPVYAKLDPSQVTDSSSDEDENIPPPSPQPGMFMHLEPSGVPGNNLPSPLEFQAKERGFSTEKCAKVEEVKLSLVAWQDNKFVTLLSSFVGIGKQDKVGRYCKKKQEPSKK
ncbi:hypothetical protein J6590_069748 [Homalodisca vitripennis]|nr:hypothetical protein J6590_069748 [Homalodisca vitripennis]